MAIPPLEVFRALHLSALGFAVLCGDALGQAVYSAEALGATGDDASDDDTPGIQAAIDAAIHFANLSGEEAKVVLRGGTEYRLRTGKRGKGHLDFSCLEAGSVTFDAQGAKIVVETPRLGILFAERSRGLVVENLVLDLDPLPFLAARVETVDAASRVVLAQPLLGATEIGLFPGYSDEWGWLHDPVIWHRPLEGAASSFRAESRVALDDGRLRFVMRPGTAMQDFAPGTLMSFHYRRGNNIRLQQCENVTLRNIVSYGAGLFFVATSHVSGLTVEHCAVLARPGRVQATGGDGVHLKYGRDVEVRSCYFEGLSDDAVNLSATFGFSITDCVFVDKRRHGIVLDTDEVPYRSRSGRIAGNLVARNGGSLLLHDGGDYASVVVAGNEGVGNNRSRAVEQARRGRLIALGATGATGAGRELRWWKADGQASVQLAVPSGATEEPVAHGRWRVIRQTTARGHRYRLEALSSGADAHPWLFLGVEQSHLDLARSVRPASPRRAERAGPDRQSWVEVPAPGGAFYLRHELSGGYLCVGGSTIRLGAREEATRWLFEPEP